MKTGSWIRLFKLETARALAAQLAIAVDYVHSQGVVHGELHLGNVLLEMPSNFDQLLVEEINEKYGETELEPGVHLDGKPLPPGVPSHGITPVWLGEASENIPLTESRLLQTLENLSYLPKRRDTNLILLW